MNTKDTMQMCPDCCYTWSEKQPDHGDQYHVFCPKHDLYEARYTEGRPLMNDRCPICEIEELKIKLYALQPTPSGPESDSVKYFIG